MPGIHLPALQGIAGLKAINVANTANLAASTGYTFDLYTVPSDRIMLLTHLSSIHGTGTAGQVIMYVSVPGVSYPCRFVYQNAVPQLTLLGWDGLALIPPGSVIKLYIVSGTSSGIVEWTVNGMTFDYFGED
jgi:hypothetical protein